MSRKTETNSNVKSAVSRDGTRIAFDRVGDGPALICVDGAFCTRKQGPGKSLAPLLGERFTVYTYDRRGRGESGDTVPYAIEREIEDLEAVVERAGGAAHVFGHSSGAVLALEAARREVAIKRLALYEVPFVVDQTRPPAPADLLEQVKAAIASDLPGRAVRRFMHDAVSAPAVVGYAMSLTPACRATASTLPYDITILGDYQKGQPLPAERWSLVSMPTLLLKGGKSPAWLKNATRALADVLPNVQEKVLDGQTHMVKAKVTAPALLEFFDSGEQPSAGPSSETPALG
jgi:pimeloyl-ACP methyl ester carboxylesterase